MLFKNITFHQNVFKTFHFRFHALFFFPGYGHYRIEKVQKNQFRHHVASKDKTNQLKKNLNFQMDMNSEGRQIFVFDKPSDLQ